MTSKIHKIQNEPNQNYLKLLINPSNLSSEIQMVESSNTPNLTSPYILYHNMDITIFSYHKFGPFYFEQN